MEKKWLIIGILIILGIASIWQFGNMLGLTIKNSSEEIIDFSADSYLDNETFIVSQYSIKDDGYFGKVFYLNGSDFVRTKRVNITENDGFSVSVLAKVEDSTNKNALGLISSSSQDDEIGFRLLYRNFDDKDRVYFNVGFAEDYAEIEKGSCLNKWCYYTLIYNPKNGNVKVYLNGDKMKEVNTNSKISASKNINIGRTIDINREYFIGDVASVKVYKGVLSDKEIKSDYEDLINLK